MKNIRLINLCVFFLLTLSVIGCSDMEKTWEPELYTYPAFELTGFSPKTGRPGTAVTFTGKNFGTYSKAAKIYFNNVLATSIVKYTDTEITVLVPDGAGVGPVSLSVWTHSEENVGIFDYKEGAKIESFSPKLGSKGDKVTILGTNFGTDTNDISVKFNGVSATIVALENTKIEVLIPDTSSGSFIVKVGPQVFDLGLYLIGEQKLTGTIIGHASSWNNDPNTYVAAAFDGNIATFIDGPTATGYAGLDLGASKKAVVTKFRYIPRQGKESRMVGGQLRGSNDPTLASYTILHTIAATPVYGSTYTEATITNSTSYRYIYYYSPNGFCNVSELEFFGIPQ